jgi:paraquat-inducible protein B
MAEAHATIDRKQGINPIWFVPIVALVIGIGMVIYTLQSQGPEITITLSTAEGIEAGKTKIKLREVDIGLVDSVVLGDDRESVVVTCSLDKSAEDLLREDTQLWVVRPRIGAGGVSGLGTLLSGGYIQLAPGEGAAGTRNFVGLEEPPVTPTGTPGAKIILTAERAGAVGPGDPVLFRGYTIGRVETETFDAEKKLMNYSVFIDAPYNELLTTTHRFWDVSGITVEAGADGIRASSVALETLLIGGVEVGLPEGISPGAPARSGEVFKLYDDFLTVNRRPYRHSL